MKLLVLSFFILITCVVQAQVNMLFTAKNGTKLYLQKENAGLDIVTDKIGKNSDGFAEGAGTISFYKAGKLQRTTTCTFVKGYRHGLATTTYAGTPTVATANFINGKYIGKWQVKGKSGFNEEVIITDTTGYAIMRTDDPPNNSLSFNVVDNNLAKTGAFINFYNDTVSIGLAIEPFGNTSLAAVITATDNFHFGQVVNGAETGMYATLKPNEAVIGHKENGHFTHRTSTPYPNIGTVEIMNTAIMLEHTYYNPFENTKFVYFPGYNHGHTLYNYSNETACDGNLLNGKIITTGNCRNLNAGYTFRTITNAAGTYRGRCYIAEHEEGTYKTKEGYTRYGTLKESYAINGLGTTELPDGTSIFSVFSNPKVYDPTSKEPLERTAFQLTYDRNKKLTALADYSGTQEGYKYWIIQRGGLTQVVRITKDDITTGQPGFELSKSDKKIKLMQGSAYIVITERGIEIMQSGAEEYVTIQFKPEDVFIKGLINKLFK